MAEIQSSSRGSWIFSNTTRAVAIVLVGLLGAWLIRFIQYRLEYKNLGPKLKEPPFNLVLGNLPVMAALYKTAPTDAHPHGVITMLQRKFNLGNMWFLDTWPASMRQMVITDPAIAAEVLQTKSLPKHPVLRSFVEHLCGKTSMLHISGAEWKKTRALFNPGFSAAQLQTQIPIIVDETSVFCEVLGEIADSGRVVPIEEPAARVTIDIMGHVVLDHDLNSQRTNNTLVEAFRKQVDWTPSVVSTNPFVGLHPLRPIMQRYYARIMDNYISKILDNRYALKAEQTSTKKGRRPAIDLAIDQYVIQQQEENVDESSRGIDKAFKRVAIDQMKTFLFAGHDTSSSTICYVYHMLSIHTEALVKVREEHDNVFGKGTTSTEVGNQIKQNPNVVNQLPYTLSVIKETLRLYPPASSVRLGDANTSVLYDGVSYPTKDLMVFVPTAAMHRRAELWPSPDEFIPERFMPTPHNFQEIVKDAWRPFEKGPRTCIGQELALLEMKIIMVMTLRYFDIKADYEEWDRKLGREKPGEILGGRRGMFGEMKRPRIH